MSVYNGSDWSDLQAVGGSSRHITSLSCQATFCMAVDDHHGALSLNDGRWTTPTSIGDSAYITDLSCSVAGASLAAGLSGAVPVCLARCRYVGAGAWGPALQIANVGAPREISCPDATFCAAIVGSGYIVTVTAS